MKEWVMVRITRKTQRRLQAFREIQLEQREKGRVEIDDSGKPGGGLPTMDAVINLLLDRDEKHRVRARKQANKKKGYTNDPAIVIDQADQQLDQADVIDVVPETPIDHFRQAWADLATRAMVEPLDSSTYRRAYLAWLDAGEPAWITEWILSR